jgi:hypothetical protein
MAETQLAKRFRFRAPAIFYPDCPKNWAINEMMP